MRDGTGTLARPAPVVPKLNCLIAYPYMAADRIPILGQLGDNVRLLVDSGAFTVMKTGKAIGLDAYCRFIETLPVRPWRYLSLDVIGDPVASRRNYDEMRRRGFDPVPVFTRGSDLRELDEYYETSDCVALGGVAGADSAAYAWARWAMEHVAGRQVHVLGFTAMEWLKYLRPSSVDSSSWNMGMRYGRAAVYLGRGRFAVVTRADARRPLAPEIVGAIRKLGFDPYSLRDDNEWTGGHGLAQWIGAASWVQASIEVERSLGVKLFLAMAAGPFNMLVNPYLAVSGQADGPALRERLKNQGDATMARRRAGPPR